MVRILIWVRGRREFCGVGGKGRGGLGWGINQRIQEELSWFSTGECVFGLVYRVIGREVYYEVEDVGEGYFMGELLWVWGGMGDFQVGVSFWCLF